MPYRILIAEDSRTQAEALRGLLEDEGYLVSVAVNGRKALELLRAARPDLILSDLFMPEMDGFAFCEAVKSSEETRSIPFMLLTQLNTPGGIAIGLQHGADDFVAKPYDEGILLRRIQAILTAKGNRTSRPEPELKNLPLERASLLLDQREQALRASNEFLEQLIATNPGVVVRGDVANQIISYVSPNVEAVLGFGVEEVIKRRTFILGRMPPDEREHTLASLREAYEAGRDQWEAECRLRHRDGSYRWFFVSARFEREPDTTGLPVVAHLLDITPRKDAEARLQRLNETLERQVAERTAAAEARARELAASEAALRQANATLSTLVACAPLAIVGTDCDGKLILWNPAAEQIFGWREAEVLGRIPPFVPAQAMDEFRRLISKVLRGERLNGLELRRRNKDGADIEVRLSAAPLYADGGQLSGVIAMLEDATLQKQLEVQLRQAQKMEAVGHLAGGVAHDFNNMLAVINGYSELILLGEELSPRARTFLEEIHRAGERASGLTRQLLAFSRRQVLEPKVVNLSAVVEDTARMLRRLIGEDISLVTQLDVHLWPVKVDPGQMEQVLVNLAVNARDAMPQGGTLTIETRNVEFRGTQAPLSTVEPGAYVMLSVADNGCGMSGEVQAHLFEPFFTTKEVGKGTGLGLATVYGIVNQSGGHITVDSAPGRGATFRIYLPVVDDEAEKGATTGAMRGSRGSETILLVEDEPMVRELARTMLESHGFTVLEATNPGEALHLWQRFTGKIHLLLTDIVMPGMSGRELYDHLRATCPELKVLFMSGYTDDAVVRHGVMSDQTAFISKPFTAAALTRKLDEILHRQR